MFSRFITFSDLAHCFSFPRFIFVCFHILPSSALAELASPLKVCSTEGEDVGLCCSLFCPHCLTRIYLTPSRCQVEDTLRKENAFRSEQVSQQFNLPTSFLYYKHLQSHSYSWYGIVWPLARGISSLMY